MAKVQKYELMVIFDSQRDEEDIRREFDVVQSLVEKRATEFIGRAVWGLKEFKYPIKKRQSGYYVYYVFKAGPDAPPQISEALKMDEIVLRHLIVRGDENSEKYLGILESGSAAQTETPAQEIEEQQAAEEETQPESTEQPEPEAAEEETPPEKAETAAQPESGEESQPSGETEEKTESEESKGQ
ncbi:30S ribosomal protein S6 [bacterium]|nr:30S ribosomal protein S6 [bacterium]